MSRRRETIGDVADELFRKNGTIITAFTCLLIITVGITLVNNPSQWWMSFIAIGVFFVVIFLFLNARVLIKSTLALLLMLLEAGWAFKLGALSDYKGSGGSVWMLSILVSFFAILAASYMLPSARSRWGTSTLTTTASVFFVYTVTLSGMPLRWSAILGGVLNVVFFILIYRFGRRSSYKIREMPVVTMDEELQTKLIERTKDYGWGAVPLKNKLKGGVLMWNSQNAFAVSSVTLPQKFGISARGRRAKGEKFLTYNGKNINAWLMNQVFQLVPYWRTRGADIMLVLLDERNGNGAEARVVGVQMPDTKARIPVGILPARNFLERNQFAELAKRMEEEFGDYVRQLSPKQLKALDMMLPTSEDSETDISASEMENTEVNNVASEPATGEG